MMKVNGGFREALLILFAVISLFFALNSYNTQRNNQVVPKVMPAVGGVDKSQVKTVNIHVETVKKDPNVVVPSLTKPNNSEIYSRIQIPQIGVNAKILGSTIGTDGRMTVPNNFIEVGLYGAGDNWFQENTTAVIGAHVDNGGNIPGVFKNLNKMKVGDEFTVYDNAGAVSNFRVVNIKVFDKDSKDTGEVFGNSNGPAKLNLITCYGNWLKSQNTYSGRLVVFTEKI